MILSTNEGLKLRRIIVKAEILLSESRYLHSKGNYIDSDEKLNYSRKISQ